ncbi:MAG: GTPase family protein, partial [Bosea sp. (in: a-proteobacteria)]
MNADDLKGWMSRTRSYLGGGIGKTVSETSAKLLPQVWQAVMAPKPDAKLDAAIAEKAAASAPVVWLIGKVQSGKSSIVRALTGASAAEIGTGFKACTRTAMVFDFPADAPVIRFLDTRGLGEAAYDAAEDIAFGEGQAHLIVAVMRALDPDQSIVLQAVSAARKRQPSWPVVVAQTCLHEAYKPGRGHVLPYPFDDLELLDAADVPTDLVRSLKHQRALFADLPGDGPISFVAIDFTLAGDGFTPDDYGRDTLVTALEAAAPAGFAAALAGPAAARERQSEPHIMGYAAAAAAADIVPLAGAVAVPAIQAKMLHSLALIHDVAWDRQVLGEFSACLGAGTATRIAASLGLRQLAKLTPVYGQTVGAAAAAATSFATTIAL